MHFAFYFTTSTAGSHGNMGISDWSRRGRQLKSRFVYRMTRPTPFLVTIVNLCYTLQMQLIFFFLGGGGGFTACGYSRNSRWSDTATSLQYVLFDPTRKH
jgi:hypothetical protein